jgi:hypothetical protein
MGPARMANTTAAIRTAMVSVMASDVAGEHQQGGRFPHHLPVSGCRRLGGLGSSSPVSVRRKDPGARAPGTPSR